MNARSGVWPAPMVDRVATTQGPWVTALLVFAWFALTAWVRPLMLPDEGRYVGVAWEMLRSGDWLVPRIDGLPFFHKPPLFYWITALSMDAFGPNALAARAAPLLGATAAVVALSWLSRRWSAAATARSAAWVLATMPLFYVGAQFANLDMLVAGCISVTIVGLADAVLGAEQGRPVTRSLMLAWVGAALGLLAKGLIGVVLPALVVGAWLVASGRWRAVRRLLWWPGMLAFGAIAAPWFVAMQARFPAFLDYFFVVQHFKRYSQGGFNNVQPFWFYPAVLLLLCLPWAGWAWAGARRAVAQWSAAQPLRPLMVCWLIVVLGFFSLPQSKLIGYVLPAVPPMAWLLADALDHGGRRWWRASTALAVALGVAAVLAIGLSGRHSAKPIGLALRQAQATGTPVVFVGTYLHDVPFYAGSTAVLHVVDDWGSPEVALHDNWRKELADAAAFAPQLAAGRLVPRDRLPALLCAQPVTWLVAPMAEAPALPWLVGRPPQALADGDGLWRLERREATAAGKLSCPGTPNGG